MPTQRYPRSARLRRPPEFRRLLRHGFVHPGRECVVRVVGAPGTSARLGIAAPRRYGNAVRRNRFRRLVREAFRSLRSELGAFDVLVTPRKVLKEPTLEGVRLDVETACRRARQQAASRGETS